jgi:cytochrome c biogenesis protein CcmG/thiol:disulfide interchange protein DsbE
MLDKAMDDASVRSLDSLDSLEPDGLGRRDLLGALLCAAASLSIAGCRASVMPRSVRHPFVGRYAPQFQRTAVSSRDVGIPGSDRTKVTVIDFWASWCGACQQTIPALDDIWRARRRDGVMVIGVSVDESEAVAESAAEQMGASFPIVVDQRLASAYVVSRIPLTFVVDQSGMVRWVGRDPGAVEQAVEVVLHE